MRLHRSLLLATCVVAAAAGAGCSGISDCGEDGAKCAALLNANAERCAASFQSPQSDEKRRFCSKAIKVVAKQKVKAAAPGLIKILQTPETTTPEDSHRSEAAKALLALDEKSAVPALIEAVEVNAGTSSDPHDKNTNLSNETIAEVLGNLGDKQACGRLVDLMKKSRHDYSVLKAMRALGQLQCKEAVPAISDVALKHDNKFMRKNAVIALGDIADPAATDTLIQMMFVEYQGVSFYREASFALFQIGPAVANALLDTMAMKNEAVNKWFEATGGAKETAIKAKCGFVLGDLRDQRAVKPLIEAFEAAAAKNDPVVLVYTSAPLGALGDPAAVPVLKKQMAILDASQREPIMRALNQLGDRSVVPEMIKLATLDSFVTACVKAGLADKDTCASDKPSLYGAQKAAADNASNLLGAENVADFKALADGEKDESIKKYFQERIARADAAAECKTDPACWAKKLKDPNKLVREKAAWELGRFKDKATIPALAEALGDTDTFVRSAAIAAYWSYGDKSALPGVEKRLKDEEGSAEYVRVNEDLKRLLVHLKRLS